MGPVRRAARAHMIGCAPLDTNDTDVAEGAITGTATRPLLTSTEAAGFTVLKYLSQAGSVTSPTVDNWNPTAGLGSVTSWTPKYTVAASGGTHTTVQAAINAATGSSRVYIKVMPWNLPRGRVRSVDGAADHALQHQLRREPDRHRLQQLRRQAQGRDRARESLRAQHQPEPVGLEHHATRPTARAAARPSRPTRRASRRRTSPSRTTSTSRTLGSAAAQAVALHHPRRPAGVRERAHARQPGHAAGGEPRRLDDRARLLQVVVHRGRRRLHLRPRHHGVRRRHDQLRQQPPLDRQHPGAPAPTRATRSAS